MPYEEVNLDCDIILCMHNDEGECCCDCHVSQLNPDKADCAQFELFAGCLDVTLKKMQIGDMLDLIEDQKIPFISLDAESPKFQTVMATKGHFCLVQGSDEDIKKFRFWKHIDGGFECTSKDQLELSF
jgi:hypothetical protein